MTDSSSEASSSLQENVIVDNDRIKKYESLLLNAVCVGQWEIARALIRTLFEEKATRDETGELLKVLILEAAGFWRESPSTPSPHHLQWLCLQEYNSLYREIKSELPDHLQDAVEFRLLLYAARELEFYNTDVAGFLCLYHDHHVAKIPQTKTVAGTTFSNPCLQFLRNCLYENPTLGHAIIDKLTCKVNNEFLGNNQILQGLYLKCIEGSLNTLVSPDGVEPDFIESEDRAKFQDLIYDLLSLMDPRPEMTELKLDRIFLRLLEFIVDTSLNQLINLFDSKKIYSCLLGRKVNYLIVEFQRVEEYVRKNQPKQLQLKMSSNGEEDDHHSGVGFRRIGDKEKWRFLFFETLYSNQHMLEHVLHEGLRLISMGELGQLADLISAPEYAPMRSLLLLLGWDRYPHTGSGQELLDTLWASEVNTQPLLHAACYKLSYQVALVQWCLDKARPFLQQRSDWSTVPFQNKATEMFDGLETHSVLYVLHHSTPLACLNPTEVIEILRMRPHVPTASGGTTPPYPFSGSATPTKYAVPTPASELSKARISTPSPTLLTSGSIFHYPRKLKPEQDRDIAIYRAFCAIKLVMDALYLCANHDSLQIGEEKLSQSGDQKKSVSTRRRLISDAKDEPVVITTSLHLPLLKDEPDEPTELSVTRRLHKAAEFVSLIQPLNFRLEILENIFSLLFLKYEDIVECKKLSAFDTSLLTMDNGKESEASFNVQTEQALKRLQKLGRETPSAFASGFIVNEQFTDELLNVLQDCLLDLTSAKYAMRRQSSASGLQIPEQVDMEMLDSAHMNCAISQSSFHQHITRLKHYINEAKWRLQLVASKMMVPKQERLSDDDSDDETTKHHADGNTSPEIEEEGNIQSTSTKRRLFSKCEDNSVGDELFVPQLQRSESSLSYSSSKPDDVSSLLQQVKEDSGEDADNEDMKESLKAKEKPTKRTRSLSSSSRLKAEEARRSLSSLHFHALSQSHNIISTMLASPQSLLYMCLQQSDYDKAKEILKMFNMEGKVGESLVHFTESYIALRQEFKRYSRFSTPKTSPQVYSYLDSRSSGEATPDSMGSTGTPTVESLKLLGTAKKETPNIALQTALLTCTTLTSPIDSVHRLLASPFINHMLFAGDVEVEKHANTIPLLRNLMQLTPTLILLDILCTNSMSGEVAKQLIAMATQRSGQVLATPILWDTSDSTDSAVNPSTPLSLLKVFVELSAFYSAFPTSVKEIRSKQDITTTLIKNYACPCDFINGYHYKFHGNTIIQYRQFMEDLYEQFGELEIMIEQVFHERLDVLEYIKNANKPTKSSSIGDQHQAIRALIVSLDKGWSSLDEASKADNVEAPSPRVNYLQALYAHLQNITEGVKVSSVQEIPRPLVMLGESPTHLLGRLIFERKFPPEMLDSFAYNLHMNLVEVIVKGCCPVIESRPAIDTRSATPIVTGPAGSLKSSVFPIVLNKQEPSSKHLDISDVCLLSYNLLVKMLSIIKEIPKSSDGCVGLKELCHAVHSHDIINVMADTSLLADVDLELLDTDFKKTVFFANVTNLLYCHTMLLYGLCMAESPLLQSTPDLIPLLFTIDDGSWLSYLTLFSCVGYRIGQLGIISCIDLHYCVLFRELPRASKLPYNFSYGNDPWLKYCCTVPPDPQILFVIGDIWNTSPFPRALRAEYSELELAVQDYLDKAVIIDPESNQVTISSFLNDYFNKFIKASDSKQPDGSDTALLKYLSLKLSTRHTAVLKPMMDDAAVAKPRKGAITIKIANTDKNFYRFAYTLSSYTQTPLPRSQSQSQINSPTLSRYMSQVVADKVHKELHSLNTKTLSYIQQRFGLVASLLQLLCQIENDDSKPPSTAEDTVEEAKPAKASSLFKALKGQTPTKEHKGKPFPEPVSKKGKKWCDLYTELLECYNQYAPLKAYIESRVSPFEEILSFRLAKNKVGEPSNKIRRHPSIADVGLASARSKVLYSATSYGLQNHTRNRRFQKALELLSSEPLANCIEDSFLVSLKQTILRITYLSLLKKENSPDPVSLLARLDDPELCARLALQSLKHWPVTTCIDVLSMCSGRLPMSSTLQNVVNKELRKMKNYSEIMELCNQEDLHRPVEEEAAAEVPSSSIRWLSWTQLANDSVSNPSSVLRQLITSKQYNLARQWAIMDGLSRELREEIEVEYLLDIFTESNNRKARAQQVLDGLCDNACSRLSVCKELLNKSQLDFTSQLFILHYIIRNLSSLFDQETMVEYANHALGIKALLCLPESATSDYSSLASEPFTLVEQLMMNMKLEWASTVITCLREDELFSHMNCSSGPGVAHLKEKPFATDNIDQLLTYYALKALEFPAPVILTPQDAFEQSVVASRQITPNQSRGSSPRTRRISLTEQKTATDPSNTQTQFEKQEISYRPPPVPPPSHRWEADSSVTKCRICKGLFGLFNRRHHCRRCGRVVCGMCSAQQMSVDGYERPQRTCNDCYNHRFPPKQLSEDSSEEEAVDQDATTLPHAPVIPPDLSAPYGLNRYRLKPGDHLTNMALRSDFNYSGSPDCPLCISLMELHSDKKQCADFILDCAHSVSLQLMPNDSGQLNEEIDKQFVIGIIRYLLLSAKVKFSTAGCHDSVELCDTYLSRVDLLKMFVSSNYKRIPSIQELTQQDSSRRIRDQLLQDDRFSLAMEISTKCNLDTTSVWASWGMAWLKVGNFEKAREKLKHCFLLPLQAIGSSQNASLLSRVIEAIESAPLAAIHDPQDEWSTVIQTATMLIEKQNDCFLDKYRYDECMYYLNKFGSPSSKVTFLFKHGFVQKACKYILEQKCSTELFLEALLVPALKRGQFDVIKHEMKSCDHSLKAWEQYLVASCRYFSKRQLFAILYEIQIFMKDFVRASMTCIKFYTGFRGKQININDLYNRIAYLYKAEEHLKTYLDAKNRSPSDIRGHLSARLMSASHEEGLAVMSISTEETFRHINCIKLQVEVTEYLYKCYNKKGIHGGSIPMVMVQKVQQPATLFGGAPVRSQVACQVLLLSSSIESGFPLVLKILKTFYLPRGKFFSQAAHMLATDGRCADIHHLLGCVRANDENHAVYTDEIILAAVKELAKTPNNEPKEIDKLVNLLNSDISKINAFIQCGKLKSAYLTAIKGRFVEEVRRISTIATQAGQTAIRDICDRWLQMNASART